MMLTFRRARRARVCQLDRAMTHHRRVRSSTLRSDLVSYRYMYPASAQGIKCYVML